MLWARATTRVITPMQLPINLGGYAHGGIGEAVDSDIEVNCLFLTDGLEDVVIVSLDLLYVTHALRKFVLTGLADIGLTERNLFMAASHTHYAPAIDETKPRLGEPDIAYRDQAAHTVLEAIRDAALGSKTVVGIASASGSVSIGVNRRKRRLLRLVRGGVEVNKVAMCPNPKGFTDPIASVIALRDEGRVLAYIWSAACHPTGLAEGRRVSAHWPGEVRAHLRELARRDDPSAGEVPVLFLQGFSGDVRPPSGRAKDRTAASLVRRARLGRTFEPLDPTEYSKWTHSARERIAWIAQRCASIAAEPSLTCERIELPASRFALGADALPPVSFQRITIGAISIVGASAEPVSGYAPLVRAMAPEGFVIPVGCIDHVVGYWPTHDMFREGGYEAHHHCSSFGIAACHPDIEATVLGQFSRLLTGDGAIEWHPSAKPRPNS